MKENIYLELNKDQTIAAIGLVITLILAFFGALWFVISVLYKKNFVGSFLTMQLNQTNFQSVPEGASHIYLDDNGFEDKNRSIYKWKLLYTYNLIITNNSDLTAYFPKLYFKESKSPFVFKVKLNEHEPILSTDAKTFVAHIEELSLTTSNDRKRGTDKPSSIENLIIILEYRNGYYSKFYTKFNVTTGKNTFYQVKPRFR